MPGHPPATRTPARRRGEGAGCPGARDGELLARRSRTGCPRGWSSRPAASPTSGPDPQSNGPAPATAAFPVSVLPVVGACGQGRPLACQGSTPGSPGRARVPRGTQAPCAPPASSPLFHVEHDSLPSDHQVMDRPRRIGRTAGPMGQWPGRPGLARQLMGDPCVRSAPTAGVGRVEPIRRRARARVRQPGWGRGRSTVLGARRSRGGWYWALSRGLGVSWRCPAGAPMFHVERSASIVGA
jgi:hypothetical protein